MNKLYVIRFLLPNGYEISRYSAWNENMIHTKIAENPEWEFTLAEDSRTHKIWDAR